MRKGGRCSSTWVMAGARQTTNSPAAQPNSTIDATPKTKESDTPPVSIPSTGTGKRSARVEAASSAARPTRVVVLCGVTANESTAAHATPKPAAQTGAMTARTRVGGRTRLVMARLPVQVVGELFGQATERDQDEREDGDEGDESWAPVQHLQPPQDACRTPTSLDPHAARHITRKGELPPVGSVGLAGGDQSGFGQRAAAPGELLAVPACERCERHALARGVDHPARAQVDPRVADRGRFRLRARGAEEREVARCELGEPDPLRRRNLAAHLVGRATLDRRGERGAAWVGLELVDPPDETGAVEAAVRLHPEGRLQLLARAAPDVREADEADGRVQDLRLPGAERGQDKGRRRVFDGLGLPALEAQN